MLILDKIQIAGDGTTAKNKLILILISMALLAACMGTGQSANLLRLEGPGGWTKHMEVAPGSTLSMVVLSENEGMGYLNELSPDGRLSSYTYFFRRYDHIPFYASRPGRYVLSYTIGGTASNTVQIDVAVPDMYQPYSRPDHNQI